ncbi:putative 60S ribosomal protein L32-2 [Monocercomonoides exilis]|uniref:putative 60S ribosomal protein L32-2 n=1 Tax=Monocercomonoides exilis TaxID=2049356 RepID=UPI00355976A6|nr:putative 60S ribosomal protein L32-2 [Monocercomonoides exilis]KAH7830792.1 putative 60S ribosomal protein L32-2 [Monocercomonoides exilis]KAH7831913.1 putative 60S ribosomal protein L32-2 [Monocercomonoides exilis]|eukprot:MONOS_3579.1-p1 / transcript=MONOS_3579.1 / gene=MONOS_3579 / organism=Monocercomonoides_exilis_PA203 / gene_product=60S ribosomal protein L32-2 / transcript_product=60S ribosomal protein L32-2 / location=Mono_scaffold00085:77550-78101(+) / protein_length=131 / sequence_SO=supercontig / SO=protein_coding / is_pseudo=false
MARKLKIVKKKRNHFPRFESDKLKTVKPSWRKPRGIDNSCRRKYRGSLLMPKIGYGSARKTRYRLPDGHYKFVVNNAHELEMIMMHSKKYAAEIAHGCSVRTRKLIRQRAAELGIHLTNGTARLRKQEAH